MSIFKKLFSSEKQNNDNNLNEKDIDNKYPLRATLKGRDALLRELGRNEDFISDDKKIIEDSINNGIVEPFKYWSISTQYLRKIYIQYSLGEPVSSIKSTYLQALGFYVKGWDEEEATYSDMIDMVSLAILFNVNDEQIKMLVDYVDKTENNPKLKGWEPDYLLGYLLHYRYPSRSIPETVLIPEMYQQLVDSTKLNRHESEKSIKSYLDKWYELHRTDPWYDNHKKPSGYRGYWCWDAAAVVKVKGLDDSTFREHPYYPNEMVHWE